MQEIDPAICRMLSIALAMIFGASGAIKLRDLELFAGSVANYQILPRALERPFAYAVPIGESACAVGILFSTTRSLAAIALALLLSLFTAAIAANVIRGRTNIDCGCFGPALRQNLSGWLLVRNLILTILAAAVALPIGNRPVQWLDVVTIALGSLSMVTLYVSANLAIGNMPKTRALEML